MPVSCGAGHNEMYILHACVQTRTRMRASERDTFRATLAGALGVRSPELVSRSPAFDRARALRAALANLDRVDEAVKRLRSFYVPVLLERPIADVIAACMEALEVRRARPRAPRRHRPHRARPRRRSTSCS